MNDQQPNSESNAVYDEWSDWYSYIYGSYDTGVDYFYDTVGKCLAGYMNAGTVMDAGCGIGLSSGGIAKAGFSVTGVDLSSASLEKCRSSLQSEHGSAVSFVQADLLSLPSDLGSFNGATALTAIIHHFLSKSDQEMFLRQIWNVLESNGVLLMSVSDYDARFAEDPDDLFSSPSTLKDNLGQEFIFFKRRIWNGKPRSRIHQSLYYKINSDDTMQCMKLRLCAIMKEEIEELLSSCGFLLVEWLPAADTGFHKNICIARKVLS